MNITIQHNHGHLKLANAHIREEKQHRVSQYHALRPDGTYGTIYSDQYDICRYAVGTVVSGGVMNRLFHASSYQPFEVGSIKEWPLYGRTPIERKPGEFKVDCCFCG